VNGETFTVQELTEDRTKDGFDYVIMSAGGSTSEKFAPLFEEAGAIVIDNSSFYRMHEDIDLIVPEINTPSLNRKIIPNTNCSTIHSVIVVKLLYDKIGVKHVHNIIYQYISGS